MVTSFFLPFFKITADLFQLVGTEPDIIALFHLITTDQSLDAAGEVVIEFFKPLVAEAELFTQLPQNQSVDLSDMLSIVLCELSLYKISRPFGVVLGKQEPEAFRQLLVAGEEAQREAVAFHTAGMLRKADLGGAQKIGDMLLCSTVVDGSDPELLAHGVWHILMQKGTPVPDCGIYYAALHRASATEEERREVIDHADEYAACMVVLSQGAKESA